jgi:hypothetical protein
MKNLSIKLIISDTKMDYNATATCNYEDITEMKEKHSLSMLDELLSELVDGYIKEKEAEQVN